MSFAISPTHTSLPVSPPNQPPAIFCGELRPNFSPFLGISKGRKVICETCLASGRLDSLNVILNGSDSGTLLRQLAELHPEMSREKIERIARERTVELETRTPSPRTWQDFTWPIHCGDYCCYIKEIGQPELVALAPDGDGPAYFTAHSPDISDIAHAHEVWADIRPDAPLDVERVFSVGVYLFTCLACGEHIILWDCD